MKITTCSIAVNLEQADGLTKEPVIPPQPVSPAARSPTIAAAPNFSKFRRVRSCLVKWKAQGSRQPSMTLEGDTLKLKSILASRDPPARHAPARRDFQPL